MRGYLNYVICFYLGVLSIVTMLGTPAAAQMDSDWIDGRHTLLLRTARDKVFSGTDFRRELTRERFTTWNFLNIDKMRIFENDEWRVWGSGSFSYRHDWSDTTFSSRGDLDIRLASIQIDKGRTSDGYLRAGRIQNFQGILPQRFDGLEVYYPFDNGVEIDIFGGFRADELTADYNTTEITGGRLGYRATRRSTVGFSWLLAHNGQQWDDQKIGGDWSIQPFRWLDLNGDWGYDIIAEELFEVQTHARIRVSRDFQVRLAYDKVTPGLLLPKSSIFSVFSLATEQRTTAQLSYIPNNHWSFSSDFTYVDFDNEGSDENEHSEHSRLDGGFQWRAGFEVAYRHNQYDELSLRFEKMMEGDFGYTITDQIRTDFDFTDVPFKDQDGVVFGELDNGFTSIRVAHRHEWSSRFSHAFDFNYTTFNERLFLTESGDDSFTSNVTLSYKALDNLDVSIGGRYLNAQADGEQVQAFLRIDHHF